MSRSWAERRKVLREENERLRAALEAIANHPEQSEPGVNPSYAVGWAFYNIQGIAKAALREHD